MTGFGTIRIAAALLIRADGRILLVRKRGTVVFMQPGGKIEPGEDAAMALCRELDEELGVRIGPEEPLYIGQFSAPAANEPGWVVQAEIFRLAWNGVVTPAAEIEEIIWADPALPGVMPLAPLTRDHVLPLCG